MFRKYYLLPVLSVCTMIALNSTVALASEHHHSMQPISNESMGGDPYTLTTCPVTGENLGAMGDLVKYDYQGREIRFCCSGCISKFEKEPDKYIQKIDAAMIEDQLPFYPLETCTISGQKLGSMMGDPVNIVYKNRLVRFCCAGCKEKFEQNPQETIKKLDEAVIEKQKENYPLDTCVVSGKKLEGMGEPVNKVIANRLVRLCCPNCVKEVENDPVAFLSKLGNGNHKPAMQKHKNHHHSN